jgi:hypothetical protein
MFERRVEVGKITGLFDTSKRFVPGPFVAVGACSVDAMNNSQQDIATVKQQQQQPECAGSQLFTGGQEFSRVQRSGSTR